MEASDGRDLFSDLQSELASLRYRVQELEQENKMLRSRLSGYHCSKEEDLTSSTEGSMSFEHADPDANEYKRFCSNKMGKHLVSSSCDHLYTCSTDPVKEDDAKLVNHLHMENLTKFTQKEMIDIKDCHARTMHDHGRRYVAFKITYFGQRFFGFASESQMDPTVESEIFKALKRTKLLVKNPEESQYSRCGRTDKGVSSTGQVVSIYVRSKVRNKQGKNENVDPIFGENCEEEIDYVRVLNKVLPKDIRVIAWCPVPTGFRARFSCLSREYMYLFWSRTLDILAMQKAAKKFVGEHDFRNFCKMDARNISNYTRKISTFEISPYGKSVFRLDENELWAMTVKGSAFLWHQVRCMMAVLFLVGQGLESPEVVDELLDIQKTPRKPQYNMAPELPLVLRYCEFEDLNFICSSDAKEALHKHLQNECQNYMLQAAIFHEALGCVPVSAEERSLNNDKKPKSHIPIMQRPTEPSFEERRAKLTMKAGRKSQLTSPGAG